MPERDSEQLRGAAGEAPVAGADAGARQYLALPDEGLLEGADQGVSLDVFHQDGGEADDVV